MTRSAVFFLSLIILILVKAPWLVAQNVVNVSAARDQTITHGLGVSNACSATHTFELADRPETNWAKIIGMRAAAIEPKNNKQFVIELNSLDLEVGTYLVEVPLTCIDCANEPGCGPIRLVFRLQMKVLSSIADINGWKEDEYVAGEILVTLRGTSKEINRAVPELEKEYQLKRVKVVELSSIGDVLVLFTNLNPNRPVPELVGRLQRDLRIESAQPNFIYTGSNAQSRDYESLQYGPNLIRADLVSGYSTGNGIRIALIDTGVDEHLDLKGRVIERKNFTDDGQYRRDIHATIMAGIISAIPHNRFGINGVARDARIISIKVLKQKSPGTGTTGTSFAIVQGVDFAIVKRANIANISFGTPQRDPTVSNMVRTAVRRGTVVVAAAGNSGPRGLPNYPAALSEVIAVSALAGDKTAYTSGTTGDYIDLAAPGVGILSTWPGNTFHDSEGSSEAAAHVTGVVALLLEKGPNRSPIAIKTLLEKTATDLGSKGRDDVFGSGLVDACRSLEELLGFSKICPDHR